MKIIFSRKGYDSSAGGCASPIFPDGSFCSLPIPRVDKNGPNLHDLNKDLGRFVDDMRKEKSDSREPVHLDPDLRASMRKRKPGWKPCFGQKASSQRHLERHGVGVGDLFLFFGWFRRVEEVNGRFRYVPGSPDLHCLWGWLQVGRKIELPGGLHSVPAWAMEHPHYVNANSREYKMNNVLYISADKLALPGWRSAIPGGGVFPRLSDDLILTAPKPNKCRSRWRLPAWFLPPDIQHALTFHRRANPWMLEGDKVILDTVGRGQEFVMDSDLFPESTAWLCRLFSMLAEKPQA